MGYCYEGRRLCCDVCGTAGARKVPCKYGYCPATAMCPACRSNPATKAAQRNHCEENCRAASAEYKAREARKEALLDAGEYVLSSARSCEDGVTVAVTFTGPFKDSMVYLMDVDTYRDVPRMEPTTVADYEKVGRVIFRARVAA
jgi:hypothetical protein